MRIHIQDQVLALFDELYDEGCQVGREDGYEQGFEDGYARAQEEVGDWYELEPPER